MLVPSRDALKPRDPAFGRRAVSGPRVPSFVQALSTRRSKSVMYILSDGGPGRTRTCDINVMSGPFYPPELRARGHGSQSRLRRDRGFNPLTDRPAIGCGSGRRKGWEAG